MDMVQGEQHSVFVGSEQLRSSAPRLIPAEARPYGGLEPDYG
jgi:hypothetical protein